MKKATAPDAFACLPRYHEPRDNRAVKLGHSQDEYGSRFGLMECHRSEEESTSCHLHASAARAIYTYLMP